MMSLLTLYALAVCVFGKKKRECTSTETETITGIIYADNYFKFWFNGEFIKEDPVIFIPHQGVEVSFEAPVCGEYTFALIAQDFSDDITGLEYDDNCVGDGGLKAMFSDGTVTNGDWRCKTIMYGPVDPEDCIPDYDEDYHFTPPLCKNNENEDEKGRSCRVDYYSYTTEWIDVDFKARGKGWKDAVEFTDDVVGFGVRPSNCTDDNTGDWICPEDVDWSTYGEEASFIWRDNLNFDNRVICRYSYFREESGY